MSTIEIQIKDLNETNKALAAAANELTSTVQTQANRIEQAKADLETDASATLTRVEADAAKKVSETLTPILPTMSKAQFDAIREQNKQQYAGSGFVDYGAELNSYEAKRISRGMMCTGDLTQSSIARSIALSYSLGDNRTAKAQKSLVAQVLVNGTIHHIKHTARPDNGYGAQIRLPDAPDGKKTYDPVTSKLTGHDTVQAAFEAAVGTNEVITSRKDIIFLESWHEVISEKGAVYPLGNVQYGASSYSGISLSADLVEQGYSAFGEWDSITKGYGATWTELSAQQQRVFLADTQNNIYFDPKTGELIQVRYRIRVVEGVSDEVKLFPGDYISGYYPATGNSRIAQQGKSVRPIVALDSITEGGSAFMYDKTGASYTGGRVSEPSAWLGHASSSVLVSYENTLTAIPIASVQRQNVGAYHPTFNPMGCAKLKHKGGSASAYWYEASSKKPLNKLECFDFENYVHADWGKLGKMSGRLDGLKYYDAVYASQVEDLRISAHKLDTYSLADSTIKKAVGGVLRGKGRMPFTTTAQFSSVTSPNKILIRESETSVSLFQRFGSLGIIKGGYPIYVHTGKKVLTVDSVGKDSVGDFFYLLGDDANELEENKTYCIYDFMTLSGEYDELEWVDIVGSPDNIAATFPEGVVGQWITKVPDDTSGYPLNRKLTGSQLSATYTEDQGLNWQVLEREFNTDSNTDLSSWSSGVVALLSYKSKSHFTAEHEGGQFVAGLNKMWVGNDARPDFGSILQSSLIGQVGTSKSYTTNAYKPLTMHTLVDSKLILDEPIEHGKLPRLGGEVGSYGCKTTYGLIEKDGLLYMQFNGSSLKLGKPETVNTVADSFTNWVKDSVYKITGPIGNKSVYKALDALDVSLDSELLYKADDGSFYHQNSGAKVLQFISHSEVSLGDDQTIPVVNHEQVKFDLNGNEVKSFCHHSLSPVGIAIR
ncbi:hypothetical protein [Pseudoalteromonas luteoviolacea]|uniref:Uncharacterized protein n=1 Tax=Pseudoalteromonas luteoviolacea NCIMB 1942 TaxID=1365253 RepID=A0A167AQV7_9GAMM|nr:hypothetical protein [Pseudoalteromonas luteoviolacea]KZN45696.1 hypothetical protein N482_14205 [Pseudoalteromonas luteoviolacea NCIMB 1942]